MIATLASLREILADRHPCVGLVANFRNVLALVHMPVGPTPCSNSHYACPQRPCSSPDHACPHPLSAGPNAQLFGNAGMPPVSPSTLTASAASSMPMTPTAQTIPGLTRSASNLPDAAAMPEQFMSNVCESSCA